MFSAYPCYLDASRNIALTDQCAVFLFQLECHLTSHSLSDVSRNAQSSWPLPSPKQSLPCPLHNCPLNLSINLTFPIAHPPTPHQLRFLRIYLLHNVKKPHQPDFPEVQQLWRHRQAEETKRQQVHRGRIREPGESMRGGGRGRA